MAMFEGGTQRAAAEGRWLSRGLIVLGLLVIVFGCVLIRWTMTTHTTTVSARGVSIVRSEQRPLQSTVIAAVLALGALLLIAGAFYSRDLKLSAPGGLGLQIGAAPPLTSADRDKVASKVQEAVLEDPKAMESTDEAVRLAAQATAHAVWTARQRKAESLPADELARLGQVPPAVAWTQLRDVPLSDEVATSAARDAVAAMRASS
jgi:hypothetical protein